MGKEQEKSLMDKLKEFDSHLEEVISEQNETLRIANQSTGSHTPGLTRVSDKQTHYSNIQRELHNFFPELENYPKNKK